MYKITFIIKNIIYKYIIWILLLAYCGSSSNENLEVDKVATTTSTTTVIQSELNIEFELPYKHYFQEVDNCNNFLGSKHEIKCFDKTEIIKVFQLDSPILNLTKSRDRLFAISKIGIVYELDLENNLTESIFDIQGKVYLESIESGLLSFYLNPYNDEFLVSYVNKNNELIFELFYFENEIKNIITSEVLLIVPIFSNSHYGGGITWSAKYQTYLVSIGDGVEANFESRLNHKPLDNSEYYGKILAISGNQDLNNLNNLILSKENNVYLGNIIASGLRNPWQFFEFEDFLIIADTGFTQNEELNVYKYSDTTPNFGWPVFEATKRSEDLDNIQNYMLDAEIFYWEDNQKEDGLSFVEKNSIRPVFYYNHHPCYSESNENCDGKADIYRAAIIGGDIIYNVNSIYNFDIFFADYISQELFSLNLITNELNIFPIPGISTITSIKINIGENDEIIASTYDGSIYIIKLPSLK